MMDECGHTWPSGGPSYGPSHLPRIPQDHVRDPSSAASLPSTSLPLQVSDGNPLYDGSEQQIVLDHPSHAGLHTML